MCPSLEPRIEEKVADVGVLFVHGIGEQRPGETLLQFGEPLCRYIEQLVESTVGRTDGDCNVRSASLSQESGAPASAVVEFTTKDKDGEYRHHRWRLAESCWAETFRRPPYLSFVWWIVSAGWWAVVLHFSARAQEAHRLLGEGIKRADEDRARGLRGWSVGDSITASGMGRILFVLPVAALIGIPLFLVSMLFAAVLPLLSLLPLTQKAAKAVQGILSGTVGDSFVLATSPIQRAAMLTRFAKDLAWLSDRERCRSVVVLAHSQGAAVATGALMDSRPLPGNLKRLITFGAGNRKLFGLEQVWAQPLLVRLGGLGLFIAAVLVWTCLAWALVQGGNGSPAWVPWAGALISLVVVWLLAWASLAIRDPRPEPPTMSVERSDFSATHDLVSAGTLVEFKVSDHQPTPDAFVPAPDASEDVKSTMAKMRKVVEDLRTATERTIKDRHGIEVNNRGSWLEDHTTYWKNSEQFIAEVARLIASAASASLPGPEVREPPSSRSSFQRRRARVILLGWFSRIALIASAFLLVAFWTQMADIGRVATEVAERPLTAGWSWPIPSRLKSADVQQGLGVALLLVGILVLHRLNLAMWLWWGRRELPHHFRGDASYPRVPVVGAIFTGTGLALAGVTIWSIAHSGLSVVWGVIPLFAAFLMAVRFATLPRSSAG